MNKRQILIEDIHVIAHAVAPYQGVPITGVGLIKHLTKCLTALKVLPVVDGQTMTPELDTLATADLWLMHDALDRMWANRGQTV